MNEIQQELLTIQNKIEKCFATNFISSINKKQAALKIFAENSLTLIRQIDNIGQQSFLFMAQDNKENISKEHITFNKNLFNFLSSAISLVDITRNFMKNNYSEESEIFKKYQQKIDEMFKASEVACFVKDLRNFSLHRELPESKVYGSLNFTNKTQEVGFYLETASLLEWDKWTSKSKLYLDNIGAELLLYKFNFVREYSTLVLDFHDWLNNMLTNAHYDELIEFKRLKHIENELLDKLNNSSQT